MSTYSFHCDVQFTSEDLMRSLDAFKRFTLDPMIERLARDPLWLVREKRHHLARELRRAALMVRYG